MTYEEISKAHGGRQSPQEIERHEELFNQYLIDHPLNADASDEERDAVLEAASKFAAHLDDDLYPL